MTPPSDHDIAAIRRQLEADGNVGVAFDAVLAYVDQLQDRLAALEHERDEFAATAKSAADAYGMALMREKTAEAALLSLQAGIREHVNRLLCSDNSTDVRRGQELQAALLPDTAGTTSLKNDDDDQARVDREKQAATDRIYRVQQNGEK